MTLCFCIHFLQDLPLLKQFICPFTGKILDPVKTGKQEIIKWINANKLISFIKECVGCNKENS